MHRHERDCGVWFQVAKQLIESRVFFNGVGALLKSVLSAGLSPVGDSVAPFSLVPGCTLSPFPASDLDLWCPRSL